MLLLQFKRAEAALAGGRLDEAWRIASKPRVRAHRRGQALIQNLLAAWTRRGNEHLDHGRLDQAMQDYRRAAGIEPNDRNVASLGQKLRQALDSHERHRQRKDHALQHVADRIASGSWSAARHALNNLSGTQNGTPSLMNDLDRRESSLRRQTEAAAAALETRDWARVAALLVQARSIRSTDSTVEQLRRRLIDEAGEQLREAYLGARLAEAEPLAATLQPLIHTTDRPGPIITSLGALTETRDALATGDLERAARHAGRAASLVPEAQWTRQLTSDLQQALDTLRDALNGPLAALTTTSSDHPADVDTATLMSPAPTPRPTPAPEPAARQHEILCIDGVGSFLLCHGSSVSIGPAASEHHDIPLLTDPSATAMTIQREEEGYTLRSDSQIQVLRHDQRISLPPNNRIRFCQPHPASGSAVVEIVRGRIANTDARHAILLDHQFVIGAGPQAHVRVDTLDPSIVVYLRPDGLWARPAGSDQQAAVQLNLDQSVSVNGLRMRRERLTP
ncbi:tetratricopeptide repeat protein [Mucisphaera calidilacus]|uniref:Tetratricopeptide repeat protein n=1 Tax=Mucisphaera calidilacus TaxID=2527982 RepID=A0A518BW98_9BACT|nr:tetratricopeptide repeat protein [Mucisphaera calidilacus]QDU71259.1 Tetratricopeptide repeat protein [Mucisphaera calidilacus]